MEVDDGTSTREREKDSFDEFAPPAASSHLSHQSLSVSRADAPWVEKYRPKNLSDVAAHREIVETIDRLTSENKLPHLLLYGPPGTGKTSTILAVARKLYGTQYKRMTLELNASDERGIDVVREQIQDFASTQSISFGAKAQVKLVLLDEADAMTKDAQFALRRIIEKYTRNTRFCLICNYVSKIIPALQSRCTRFRFPPLSVVHVRERLLHVSKAENISISDQGIDAVVKISSGDMRKALNVLQATYMASTSAVPGATTPVSSPTSAGDPGQITDDSVYLCTGNPRPVDIERAITCLLNKSFKEAYQEIIDIQLQRGLALVDVLGEMLSFVMRVDMPSHVRTPLLEAMADIEHRLASVGNERIQLSALVAAFVHVREGMVASAK